MYGREREPSAGIMDTQSVKTTLVAGEARGFDAGKRVKGRKRHIVVDTLGLLLAVVIQSASVQERNGADEVIGRLQECWCKVRMVFADGGYSGKLVERIKKVFGIEVSIVQKISSASFVLLPKWWVVERTFAWLDTNRRASKNYERLNNTSVTMVHLSAIRIMLNHF